MRKRLVTLSCRVITDDNYPGFAVYIMDQTQRLFGYTASIIADDSEHIKHQLNGFDTEERAAGSAPYLFRQFANKKG